ncbi:recombinase family protein [Rhodococcus sp. NPDC077669]|uniref:recombinase family protein n=1 Tax=Nocardiaceae TaxID=85025 RepID=UPI00342E5E63
MKIGYARCSTARQDTSVQIGLLAKIGVERDRVYIDHAVSGRQAKRPGLENAINASRDGDEFCVTKLDRLSRSAGDLHETVNRLAARGVALLIDGKVYDPADPMGKMFIGMLGLMAEFESDLIRARTRDARHRRGRCRRQDERTAPYAYPGRAGLSASGVRNSSVQDRNTLQEHRIETIRPLQQPHPRQGRTRRSSSRER